MEKKKRFTDLSVEKMAPVEGKRLEVFDTLTPGLALRVTEGGKKSWSVMYRVAGRGTGGNRGPLRRMTLGAFPLIDVKTAREKARAALELADRGDDPADKRRDEARQKGERVFEVICGRFIGLHAKAHTQKWRDTERLLNTFAVPAWKGKPIDTIDRAAAHELLDDIAMDHGTGAAREVRKHVTKLFNWAVDRGLLAASPVAGMRRPELGYTPRERVLSMDELRDVWAAADEMGYPFGPMVRLLILTAQRRAEVANLDRGWLLPEQQAFEVPASHYKTARPQVVPLSAPARAIVEALPKWNGGTFLLSTTAGKRPVSGFSKAKARLDRLSGVEGWTLHDLRRSAATHMARLGVAQEHIERVLGHAIEGVAGTYNRYSYLPEKRAALDAWGQEWV
ncbi:MAG: integrase arm-type DNA-binding domain-containing protein [Rhodobacteraceae bacterium]|nr:integrase arm-type DNA-binding domain-containing protein [Paracoccaceae bacterium]